MPSVATKSVQEMQDDIFRNMSANKKLEVAAGLWRLAKELDHEKIDFRNKRPAPSSYRSRKGAHKA
jgi:hypothetical protein